MEPQKIEYAIGNDVYGRPVRLIRTLKGGQPEWSIVSDPISQRDEGERIYSLTTQNLATIGQIVTTRAFK